MLGFLYRKLLGFSSKKTEIVNDRLSNLPEALQLHILSFLDTKQAVQTSLLSKQWLNLWTLLSDFDFRTRTSQHFSSIDAIVEKLFSLRDDSVKINSFVFVRRAPTTITKYFDTVLDFVVSHRVQSLTLTLRNPLNEQKYCMAMKRLCSFDFLKSMKLECSELDHLLSLKQLVTLDVDCVRFNSSEDFSGCPNLEGLTLKYLYNYGGPPDLVVVAPKLSRLIISYRTESDNTKFVLSTPRLTFFGCKGNNPLFVETVDMPHLHKIDMDVSSRKYLEQDCIWKLITTLKGFSAAKVVRLSSSILECLSKFRDILAREPSPFCNLKVLTVSPNATTAVTAYLLGKCPNAIAVVEQPRYSILQQFRN